MGASSDLGQPFLPRQKRFFANSETDFEKSPLISVLWCYYFFFILDLSWFTLSVVVVVLLLVF